MASKNSEQESEQGFMQRWSKRKIESTTTIDDNLENNNITDNAISESLTADSAPPAHKTDADMTPLEELTEESNYSDFLSPDVSDTLRKLALRKLFHLPLFNVVDGLDDYAEDYTKFTALGDIIPHDMKRMLEREKRKELEQIEELEEQQQTLNNQDLPTDELENYAEENNKHIALSDINKDDIELSSADDLTNLKDEDENEKLN